MKRLVLFLVAIVMMFSLLGFNKVSAEESNVLGSLEVYQVYIDGDSTELSSIEPLFEEKDNFVLGSKITLNYLCLDGFSDIYPYEYDGSYDVRFDVILGLKANTKINSFEFIISEIDSIAFLNDSQLVYQEDFFRNNDFNYLNFTDFEALEVDTLRLTINSFKDSNKNNVGPYLVVNEEAKVFNEAYQSGYNKGFENGSHLGYEVGYTEGVRNNADTIKVKDEVLDDNTFKLIIGLSGAVLLIGFVVLCLSKTKKRRRK